MCGSVSASSSASDVGYATDGISDNSVSDGNSAGECEDALGGLSCSNHGKCRACLVPCAACHFQWEEYWKGGMWWTAVLIPCLDWHMRVTRPARIIGEADDGGGESCEYETV